MRTLLVVCFYIHTCYTMTAITLRFSCWVGQPSLACSRVSYIFLHLMFGRLKLTCNAIHKACDSIGGREQHVPTLYRAFAPTRTTFSYISRRRTHFTTEPPCLSVLLVSLPLSDEPHLRLNSVRGKEVVWSADSLRVSCSCS